MYACISVCVSVCLSTERTERRHGIHTPRAYDLPTYYFSKKHADARLRNTLGMVRLLTRLGANPNALRTTDGLSPLQLACGAESDAPASEGVLLQLLQTGAAPNGNARWVGGLVVLLL